jgi:hypothetical protein
MRVVLELEDEILLRAKNVLDLLCVVKADCEVQVHWREKEVRILHNGKKLIGTIPFDSLLSPETSAKNIADHLLSCIKG